MNCKNCQKEMLETEPFCAHCGQKLISTRITLRQLFNNLLKIIFNVDRGFWHTLFSLFSQPEKVIKDYIGGATVKYYDPFQYAFLIAGISALISSQLDIYEVFNSNLQLKDSSKESLQIQKELINILKQYMNVFMLLIVPFVSLVSYWFWRKKGYSFGEMLIFNAYAFSQTMLMNISLLFVPYFFPTLINLNYVFSALVHGFYYTYLTRRFFNFSRLKSFLQGFGLYLIAMLLFILTMIVFSTIFTIIYSMFWASK